MLCTEISQPQKSSASTFSSVFWFSDRKWRRVTLHSTVSERIPDATAGGAGKGWETKTSTTGGFFYYTDGGTNTANSSSIKISYRRRKKKNVEK